MSKKETKAIIKAIKSMNGIQLMRGGVYAIVMQNEVPNEIGMKICQQFKEVAGIEAVILNGFGISEIPQATIQGLLLITSERIREILPQYSKNGVTVPIEIIPDLIAGREGIIPNKQKPKEKAMATKVKATKKAPAKATKKAPAKAKKATVVEAVAKSKAKVKGKK